jgi:hypothetical protein
MNTLTSLDGPFARIGFVSVLFDRPLQRGARTPAVASAGRQGTIRRALRTTGAIMLLAAALAAPPKGSAATDPQNPAPADIVARPGETRSVLFVGNSFFYGDGSAVRFYRSQSVTDLNGDGVGGVPALFKLFTEQAGLDIAVSLETVGGAGLDHHVEKKTAIIGRPWDCVVLQTFSTLDRNKPGDPALLIRSTKQAADLLRSGNPNVEIHLVATWSRADQTYPESGAWHGRPIEAMAAEVRVGYDLAAAGEPAIRGVIPVGEAWTRAMRAGVADPNPYDGIAPGQLDLWAFDHYHASTAGYYLEALVIFADLTGLDPRSLGKNERVAFELGLSGAPASALQQVAFDELTAQRPGRALKAFTPTAARR